MLEAKCPDTIFNIIDNISLVVVSWAPVLPSFSIHPKFFCCRIIYYLLGLARVLWKRSQVVWNFVRPHLLSGCLNNKKVPIMKRIYNCIWGCRKSTFCSVVEDKLLRDSDLGKLQHHLLLEPGTVSWIGCVSH